MRPRRKERDEGKRKVAENPRHSPRPVLSAGRCFLLLVASYPLVS